MTEVVTGGIVTVTAAALMEDPFGVYRIMKLVEQHPFWMCYIHPYVLAALIKRDYPNSDPSTLVQSYVPVYLLRCRLAENRRTGVTSSTLSF